MKYVIGFLIGTLFVGVVVYSPIPDVMMMLYEDRARRIVEIKAQAKVQDEINELREAVKEGAKLYNEAQKKGFKGKTENSIFQHYSMNKHGALKE